MAFTQQWFWNYFRGNGYHSEQWNNIGTWVQRAIIPLKSELVMGDGNTGSDIFDGVGFRGVRLYSSDNMYPDSQQGFAPTVRGIARTAAQLTIRQNGFIIYQSYVSPGAFEITDLHPTSSNGDLDVTIDERDGNQQNYTIPYSTVPILQREGRFKFDLTAGDFRSGNSQQSSPFFFRARHSAVYHRNLLPTAGRNYLPITPPFIRAGAQPRELGGSVAGCDPCAQSVSRRQSS